MRRCRVVLVYVTGDVSDRFLGVHFPRVLRGHFLINSALFCSNLFLS